MATNSYVPEQFSATVVSAPGAITPIRILSFESKYQKQVTELFVYGLSSYKSYVSPEIAKAQAIFINSKLAADGDMYDVHQTYILGPDTSHFWVAVDDDDKVLGIVGVIASTYKSSNKVIYDQTDLNPGNVCELVRMSVHPDARGLGLGRQLCSTVENFGRLHGMKKVVLSTLSVMFLAVALYKKCGYLLLREEEIQVDTIDIVVAHFGKSL
jgi:ribosomal protein S18 acetylase RimI-like enzyme